MILLILLKRANSMKAITRWGTPFVAAGLARPAHQTMPHPRVKFLIMKNSAIALACSINCAAFSWANTLFTKAGPPTDYAPFTQSELEAPAFEAPYVPSNVHGAKAII